MLHPHPLKRKVEVMREVAAMSYCRLEAASVELGRSALSDSSSASPFFLPFFILFLSATHLLADDLLFMYFYTLTPFMRSKSLLSNEKNLIYIDAFPSALSFLASNDAVP